MTMIRQGENRKNRLNPKAARAIFGRPYYFDLNSDYHNSIVLAGTGRSGTTWISEVINYQNGFRVMDEPFRNISVPIVSHFNALQYIRPDDKSPEFLGPAQQIFSGRLRNTWTDRHNRKLLASRRFVKIIRANMFLKWIVNNFPGMPIAFIMRHPCAVVLSQSQLEWDVDLHSIFLTQPALVEDYLEPFRADIERAESLFEKRLWLWCVENAVALRQLQPGDVKVVFYESFCDEPESEFARLFAHYGMTWNESVYGVLQRPSASSKLDSAIVLGKRPVDNWMSIITDDQRATVERMLGRFGLDSIYSVDSPWPNGDGVQSLMAT